jgi:hypothetical protein
MVLPLFLIACICCTSIFAQDQDKVALDRLLAGRAQYYTPTTSGLKSFHCDASIDWKSMLTRLGGTEIPDDDPVLKYLQTIRLSVADQLNGKGSMEWAEAGVPPKGAEQNLKRISDGLQTDMAGFFRDWNAYMNGSIVPLPSSKAIVTIMGTGVHIRATSEATSVDEDFDQNMLLMQVLVVSPEMRLLAKPSYVETSDGLVISSVTYTVNRPPSAPQEQTILRMEYAKVDSFQIPSKVIIDTRNIGVIEVGFNACQVSVAGAEPKLSSNKQLIDSQKPSGAAGGQLYGAHASCGFQTTEVPVIAVPGVSSEIAAVKCDETLTIIYDESGYYKVRTGNGKKGYISHASVYDPDEVNSAADGGSQGVARAGVNGVAPPSCAHCPEPRYTREASGKKYQGDIVLEAIISAEGNTTLVRAVRVLMPDKTVIDATALDRGWVSLEETAIDAAKTWRFNPTYGPNGQPITVLASIEISFRLK